MEDINKIMKTYKEEQKRLTKTKKDVNLEKKEQEISSNEIDIKRKIMHIERLKEERENYKDAVAMDDIAIREEYDKNIKNEEDRLEKQKNSLEDLKKEKNILAINKDKKNEEVKKKILQKMNENQDKLRKDLTAEQKKLELETKKLKVQYDMKRIEIDEFQYQYDEKGVPTNGEEYRKMNEEALKIHEDMKKCEENIGLCKKELEKSREVISDIPKLSKYEIYDESVLDKNIEKTEKVEKTANVENSEKNTQGQTKSTEEIIKEIQKETEEQNRNYGNVHLEAGPYVDKVNVSKQTQGPKNTFEIENAINNAYNQMQNDNRNITVDREIEQMARENNRTTKSANRPNQATKAKTVEYIEILEKEGNINYYIDGDEQEHTISIKQALEEKKDKFKRLGISDMCKEITGGRIKGALLKRKVNPEIVAALGNNTDQIKEYISNIYYEEDLPFQLVHNLEKTSILSKIKLNKFVKVEEICGAWVSGKLFDKNRAIVAKEKTKAIAGNVKEAAKEKTAKIKDFSQEKYQTAKSKGRDFVQRIPNKDSKIEATARQAIAQKESERELANNVQKIMQEQGEKER